ncbi:MAG: DUF5681 domain-containing protein [Pseudomonadota bacterium]
MSKEKAKDKERRALAARPGYDVGYGKPPKDTRFKPGQSGNPKGRPKGSKNKRPGMHEERMKDIILDEAYRDITVNDGDRRATIPMVQAVMRSVAVNAAKGQARAQRLFAELLASVENSRKALHDQWLDTAIEYKVEWEKELRRREQLGITDLPDPLPHPDHVKIDMIEGTAVVAGPATKEDKAEYDWFVERREMFEEELKDLEDERATASDPRLINRLDKDIQQIRQILQAIGQRLPD